jgi:SH3-like domain-containing protein
MVFQISASGGRVALSRADHKPRQAEVDAIGDPSRNKVARRIGRVRAEQSMTRHWTRTGQFVALILYFGAGALAANAQQSPPAGAAPIESAASAAPAPQAKAPIRDPNIGAVTQLPLPRYVSLKTNEGNARRGPGLSHRIDWVFTMAGMPLLVTAEYENWRRVEDVDGAGGWVHYTLLSSARSSLVVQDMAEFLTDPKPGATVAFQAEYGVLARILECSADWCRVSVDGTQGWTQKLALWGVGATEIVE